MSCTTSPQLRLLILRWPQRAPFSSCSSSSSSAAGSNHIFSDKFCRFPILSLQRIDCSLNIIDFSRRNRSAAMCFRSFVAQEESAEAISVKYEESNGISTKECIHRYEDRDGDRSNVVVDPSFDIDLKERKRKFGSFVSAAAAAARLFRTIIRGRRRIPGGVQMNAALITCLLVFLLAFDWYSWWTARLPLQPFQFSRTFLISAALSGFAGWLYVPIVNKMRIHQVLREEGPRSHSSKRGTPTMGGLFFIPIGIAVAGKIANYNSSLVFGSVLATLAFAAIGLIDDLLSYIKGHNYGLPGWIKFSLQAAVGACFSFCLNWVNISMPSNMNLSVHLPQPFGLLYLGKYYLALTTFCFAAMSNGVNLTDGLDGLAGGVAAWAFIGMSVAVLAISPELSIFGASMAGACVGFLFHNRYKASIFMGDTGSLGLGGALASMASCTGMFLPLFISSGIFVMEVLSVIVQVLFMKVTRKLYGVRRRVFRMSPIHHHFELCGYKEPVIVASAYFISCILALIAGYIGIIST
ncbi:phospho-N-acetylmuramoyl-pentapeptide-transferase homolog [Phalaenopsis equestris]|uniref:phospho-N-acetylmuramoyl-pentapeptide- transferase homolog n=1 Tax=Phalaenopsis equestris TaxID=78828 RepID=UPI0009E5B222|nr:phospho-N-acetylmuramoyl-pentapeptide-transferase homolog [Phalaenopsis equestris]